MRVFFGLMGLSVSGVYLVQISLLFIRFWDISSGIGPCFPLAGGSCKFYVNTGGKRPKQHQARYKQQANPLLSMNNYTPLMISRSDKNKQLTF
jgi:hypothetical protein